jgi:hypothetical protein
MLAVKLAVVVAAGTVTEAGKVRTLGMAPDIATGTPPVGAALVNVTVQVELVVTGWTPAGVGSELAGSVGAVHARELTVVGAGLTLTVPVVAATAEGSPPGVEATEPLIPMLIAAEPLTVADTVAITPFAIAVAFIPLAMQLYPADAAAHVNVLPAAVNAGPAETEILDTLAG